MSYLEPIVDKYNLLRGGCSNSGMSSLRSTGGGMYRDGGSGGDGNAVVTDINESLTGCYPECLGLGWTPRRR
ncbi:hypothetical protein Tco_0485750 [Tanacetum coccineum]